jgi:hypothetical protein
MIRDMIEISQWTQSIVFPLNSKNSWISCSINNLPISNHGMTQMVHNMYCEFISIQFMKSISNLYDWIFTILWSTNYIELFFHTYPSMCCINPYATCFTSSPRHGMNILLCSHKEQWEERYFFQTWTKTISFNYLSMDRPNLSVETPSLGFSWRVSTKCSLLILKNQYN